MHSDLLRPISEAELAYLRRAQGESIRTNGLLAMYAFALLAVLALYFGYLIASPNGNIWGVLLLGIGVALLALVLRIALSKNTAASMAFRPVLVTGPFSSRMVGSQKARRKLYYIGNDQVSYPGHWHNTLSRHPGALIARAALPTSAHGTSEYLAGLLLEVENGPSIDFECANTRWKHPVSNPWISLAAVLTGLPALGLLGAYTSMALDKQTDLGHSYQAVRAYLLPSTTVSDGDALAGRAPPVGRLTIERAWRIDAADVQGAPPQATLVVVSRAARDRIVAERQETARTYAAAWERFKQDLRAYEAKWPYSPLEAFPRPLQGGGPKPATRPPRPQPPVVQKQPLAASDIIAYMTRSHAADLRGPEGVDPVIAALEVTAPITAELYSNAKPYLLLPPDATRNWRQSGFGLIGGGICLLAFVPFASLMARDFIGRRRFAADMRAAYAEKRGYRLV